MPSPRPRSSALLRLANSLGSSLPELVISTHAWPRSRGRLYILDAVRVPASVLAGTELSVGVDYTAASPSARRSIGAAIGLELRTKEGALLRRLPGKSWNIKGGGGIGCMEGLLPLPGDISPGEYQLRVGLGPPASRATVWVDRPLEIARP